MLRTCALFNYVMLYTRCMKLPSRKVIKRRPALLYALLVVIAVSALATYGYSEGMAKKTKNLNEMASVITDSIDLTANMGRYLPGATMEVSGAVRIHDYDFSIVKQDGSAGQTNPPVNLYGTHLLARNDFEVSAHLGQIGQYASLYFYSEPPIIQDEFRIEPARVELVMSKDGVVVNQWDKGSTKATAIHSYDATITDQSKVAFSRVGSSFVVTVNNKALATIPAGSSLASGNIWLGASAKNGDFLLSDLIASPINGGELKVVKPYEAKVAASTSDPLQGLANKYRPGFVVGAAMALGPIAGDAEYRKVAFSGNFGSVTTENTLKWQFVEPKRGEYSFQEADALLDMANRHAMVLHGHTLIFGEANPAWVTRLPTATPLEKADVEQVMTDHIKNVMGHYKGKVPTWDVVNEPLADYDEFENGTILRNSIWSRAMGEAYIAKAFTTARQADPAAKLYMNEFGLEEDGERWDEFLSLVTRLKKAGVPIDGVGFQAHIYESGDKINVSTLTSHMRILAKLGLTSRISENDVYDDDGTSVQAKQYTNVFMACINEPSCVSWTTWGVSDRYDMYQEDGKVEYGHDFLWDAKMRPTKAEQMIIESLKHKRA